MAFLNGIPVRLEPVSAPDAAPADTEREPVASA
jgi:hypothetical protein